jgi:GAF domain-containing protein
MSSKTEQYELFLEQAKALIVSEIPLIGNLCNLLALLKKEFSHFWVGLYIRKGEMLGLGPFIGEPACTVIQWGKGVCGTAASTAETVIVDDVHAFPGYIACHPEPNSEIVVPGFINGEVQYVLDVDSVEKAKFDSIDKKYLEKFNSILSDLISKSKTQL